MTLDEAIKHAEEVAEEKDMQAGFDTDYLCYQMSDTERNQCRKCAEEHRQLAEWLKDYKRLLEQEPKIDILDKIRAEIEHLTITEGGEDYTRKMAELYSLKIKVLQIIDKCKAGSEELKGHKRKFEGIVIDYPPAELCTYPEYKGKPYFSIKYEKNGEHIIGYGTYNPEVLSRYLREYFITPTPIIEADKERKNDT